VAPKQDRGSSLVCGELTDATVAKSIAKSTSEKLRRFGLMTYAVALKNTADL
jgi:hypothetical protein